MAELNKHEIRSPELQEVMSEIPGSFLRWGLFLFFAIILAIVSVSYFISYPDIVTAPVIITTYNSPASLVARSGGKISRLFVSNEDLIAENQPIALIANQAVWSDVKSIRLFIKRLSDTTNLQKTVSLSNYPSGLSLGEMQSSYLHFLTLFNQFNNYLEQAYIPSKLALLKKQVERQIGRAHV